MLYYTIHYETPMIGQVSEILYSFNPSKNNVKEELLLEWIEDLAPVPEHAHCATMNKRFIKLFS